MNNKEKSVGTTAEKSTTVETQHPSSHSNGNTHVVRSPKFVENNIKEKKKNSQIEFSDDLSTKGD